MTTTGIVYLLHFDQPYKHARHYLGWTDHDLDARLARHARGDGARLLAVLKTAGIGWQLARTWPGDRARERQLKNMGSAARRCPLCGITPRPTTTDGGQLAMLTDDITTLPARIDPVRDQYGRYLLPDPATGQERAWTRATTWAKTLSDTTGLHKFTERHDRGEHIEPPAPWDADLAAYATTITAAGITISPAHIERITPVPDLAVAGTLDRITAVPGHGLVIADVKTAHDLRYSWGEIAIQLAIYAHGAGLWTGTGYDPMPEVSQTRALVIHLPAGQARCDLHWIDIQAGWDAAKLAAHARAWRCRRDLAEPFTAGEGPGGGPRNVLIRRQDGTTVVRPFRGLRKPPEDTATDPEAPRDQRG
jgi:predicted GIY-YIG superfamily endonuclease